MEQPVKIRGSFNLFCFSLFYARAEFHLLFQEIKIFLEKHASSVNHFVIFVYPYYDNGRINIIMGSSMKQFPVLKNEFENHFNSYMSIKPSKKRDKLPYGKEIWVDNRFNTIAYNAFDILPLYKTNRLFLFQKLLSSLIIEVINDDYEENAISFITFIYITISKKEVLPLHDLLTIVGYKNELAASETDIETLRYYSNPIWDDIKIKHIYESFISELNQLYGISSHKKTFLKLVQIIDEMLSVPNDVSSYLWKSICAYRKTDELIAGKAQ